MRATNSEQRQTHHTANRFVADGHERAVTSANEAFADRLAEIEAEVRAEHADALGTANWFWRFVLRNRIEREIRRHRRREIDRVAPRDALYSRD